MATTAKPETASADTGKEVSPEEKKQKDEERRAKTKAAVKAATEELHAMRPQPRSDQIEQVLDQIRNSTEEPPADAKAAKAKAKELFEKSNPKEEVKPAGADAGKSASPAA